VKHEVQVGDLVAGMTRTMERLRMNKVENNEAYEEGKAAFASGETRDVNPYRTSSSGFHHWFAGWDEADQADRMDLIKMAKADDLRKD
jgi:ribosome modulation factor